MVGGDGDGSGGGGGRRRRGSECTLRRNRDCGRTVQATGWQAGDGGLNSSLPCRRYCLPNGRYVRTRARRREERPATDIGRTKLDGLVGVVAREKRRRECDLFSRRDRRGRIIALIRRSIN